MLLRYRPPTFQVVMYRVHPLEGPKKGALRPSTPQRRAFLNFPHSFSISACCFRKATAGAGRSIHPAPAASAPVRRVVAEQTRTA